MVLVTMSFFILIIRMERVMKLPEIISVYMDDFDLYCIKAFGERMNRIFVVEESSMDAFIVLKRDNNLNESYYTLEADDFGIGIYASSERGVIYALTDLYLRIDGDKVRSFEVTDGPKYPHRAISFDSCRHFFDATEVKRIIDQLSLVKMSVFHWHLSDDQGFRIESKIYPRLNEISCAYYTQDEIREIVEYARDRGIDVLPEIDMPGHTSSILAAYPEYGCAGKIIPLATRGGIYADILCAGKERVYDFLENLLKEVCGLFPYKRFHIGGDEAPRKAWKACPDCKRKLEMLKADGYFGEGYEPTFSDLQGYFTKRVTDIIRECEKSPVAWNEVLGSKDIPDDIVVQFWSPDAEGDSVSYVKEGGRFIYSNMYELYLDYPHSMTSLKKICNVSAEIGGMKCDELSGMMGYESPVWTEQIDNNETLEKRLFPRAYAVGLLGWNGEIADYDDFDEGLNIILDKAKDAGIHVTDKDWWNPEGDKRLEEALDFMKGMYDGPNEAADESESSPEEEKAWLEHYVKMFFRPEDIEYIMKLVEEVTN